MSLSGKLKARFIECVNERLSHTQIETLFIEYEVEGYNRQLNKQQNLNIFVRDCDEDVLDSVVLEKSYGFVNSGDTEKSQKLLSQLRLEGYDLGSESIIQIEPEGYSISEIDSFIINYFEDNTYNVSLTHFQQAIENFELNNYEASNGQIRTSYESFIIQFVNNKYSQNNTAVPNALTVLLQKQEIDQNEFDQFKSFWHGIQDNGPHPGISDYEESLFRIHSLIVFFRYLIKKCS